MTDIQNPSFEEAGAGPGEALGWTLITSVANQEFALFDGVGYEDFELWHAFIENSDSFIEATFGVIDAAEDFEKLWGPFDGSDPKFGVLVPPIGYPGNQGFLFELGQTADAEFFGSGGAESFEVGWGQDTPLFSWDDVDSELAIFDSGLTFENFEEGWGNDDYIFEFAPIQLDDASFYFQTPRTFDSFEDALPFEDIGQILLPQVGLYTASLNGNPFSYTALGGDNTEDIAVGIIDRITNSSLKFSASLLTASRIGFINNDPNQDLTTVISGPTQGTVALVTDEFKQDFWLLPDKGII